MKCAVVKPEAKKACGAQATHVLTFIDKDKAYACEECALLTEQVARQHNSPLHVEKLS